MASPPPIRPLTLAPSCSSWPSCCSPPGSRCGARFASIPQGRYGSTDYTGYAGTRVRRVRGDVERGFALLTPPVCTKDKRSAPRKWTSRTVVPGPRVPDGPSYARTGGPGTGRMTAVPVQSARADDRAFAARAPSCVDAARTVLRPRLRRRRGAGGGGPAPRHRRAPCRRRPDRLRDGLFRDLVGVDELHLVRVGL